MEPNSSNPVTDAESSMDAVEELNPDRQLRPPRYWYMLGAVLAVFVLMPLSNAVLPPMASAIFPPVAILLIIVVVSWCRGVVVSWKNPTMVRYIRLRGLMWLAYGGGALLLAVLAAVDFFLYAAVGGWWIPLGTALTVFLVVAWADRPWTAGGRPMPATGTAGVSGRKRMPSMTA